MKFRRGILESSDNVILYVYPPPMKFRRGILESSDSVRTTPNFHECTDLQAIVFDVILFNAKLAVYYF